MKTSNRLLIVGMVGPLLIIALLFISSFLVGGPRGDEASKQEGGSAKPITWTVSSDITSNLDVLEKGSIRGRIRAKDDKRESAWPRQASLL